MFVCFVFCVPPSVTSAAKKFGFLSPSRGEFLGLCVCVCVCVNLLSSFRTLLTKIKKNIVLPAQNPSCGLSFRKHFNFVLDLSFVMYILK